MRRAAWFLNVVPRTLRAFLPALARPDDAFARQVLPEPELGLYLGMDPRDRHHGVAVARAVAARCGEPDPRLLRAALLHDVGKSRAPYRAWERIAVHLYTPREGRSRRLQAPLHDAWERHRRHAAEGAAMILAAGGDPEVAALVARHHDAAGDARLTLLAEADGST